jgi:hypothetical protein
MPILSKVRREPLAIHTEFVIHLLTEVVVCIKYNKRVPQRNQDSTIGKGDRGRVKEAKVVILL